MGYSVRIGQMIDKEIEFAKEAPVDTVPVGETEEEQEAYRQGYIQALENAKKQVVQMEQIDKDAPLETLEDTLIMVEENLTEDEANQIVQILVNKFGEDILEVI